MVGGKSAVSPLDVIAAVDGKLKAANELLEATKILSKTLKELPEKSLKTKNAIALLDHAIWRYEKS